ncbi:hypothetical protein L6452_14443 [Arctium lappa]|uniref:Uncharacterized protein n=1 Tax=Arctium lappa TaxID=4217 RepID=A0ACB9CL19_ARCLA|nr:hypothetical protein L6452_14443 [Arctium lappa]
MVANEQASSENHVQKASIDLPSKVFSQPPTYLASNPEASIEDHFRYIYCMIMEEEKSEWAWLKSDEQWNPIVNQVKKIFLASEVSKYSDETLRGIKKMIHVKEERHRADLLAKLDLEIDSMINFRALIMKFHGISEDIRDGFIRGSEDNVRALKTFSLKMALKTFLKYQNR